MVSIPASKLPSPAWRNRASSILTVFAHGTAPFITTFLFVHLTAPVIANIGGSSDASRTMVFGRQYYQTVFGERYLVFAPLLVHATSGFLKRIFAPRPPGPRRLSSALSATGYACMLFLLPVHVATHRLGPADATQPVWSAAPPELDYEFVKIALHDWPIRSTALYVAIVLGVVLHAADGFGVIWSTWAPKRKLPGWRVRRTIVGVAVLPVITGIAAIAREPLYAFAFTVARYRAALTHSFVYRI